MNVGLQVQQQEEKKKNKKKKKKKKNKKDLKGVGTLILFGGARDVRLRS